MRFQLLPIALLSLPLWLSCSSEETTGGTDAGGSAPTGTREDGGRPGTEPDGAFIENRGHNCQVGEIPRSINSQTLPDPFTKLDGSRITTKAEWRCRRQEILRTVTEHVYGWKPGKPESVTGTVSDNSITVDVSHQGKSISFQANVSLPSGGTAPYPAIITLGGFGGVDSSIRAEEGVANISYDPMTLGREIGSRANPTQAKSGAFFDLYGTTDYAGILVAWAWGVSRIIDVIEASDGSILRADGIGVTGCSRFGKGAFTIGAFDERIALTIPIESGSGGVPLWRGLSGEGAQSPTSAYGEQLWLGDAFGNFISNVNTLPADTHQVVAMVAPRGLLILDNPHIPNLGPRSAHVAALAGAEVYKALGAEENISYHSNVQEGMHCAWRSEWNDPFRNAIRKHLTKTGNAPGVITARSQTTGNLSEWIDWTTPTLQ